MNTQRIFLKPIFIGLLSAILMLVAMRAAQAAFSPSNGQAATLVLGQANFTSSGAATTQTGMNRPQGVAVDPTTTPGKVFVADGDNNRVLRFASAAALTNGAAAEAVLGQANFTSNASATTQSGMNSPLSVFVDSGGRLWVADLDNSRVLRFDNAASKANGANADGVLGQANFTSSGFATTQNGMNRPVSVFVDSSGRLWVADVINHRMLRFDNAAAKMNGANADGVLGQANFTSNATATTQSGMYEPTGVFVDSGGRLWVTDANNDRVLRFDNAAAKANGANANGVLGQVNFTSSGAATTQSGMFRPFGVTGDGAGRLYVADQNNQRILIFNTAATLANGANADFVLGQTNFTTGTSGTSATKLKLPFGLFYDTAINLLWAADTFNNRVLMYGTPPSSTTTTLGSSVNPSTFGQSVTFTATVSGTGGTPTGTVTFKDGGTNITSCAAQALSSGQATCTTSSLAIGTHTITVVYSGDTDFNSSTDTLSPNQAVNNSFLYLPLIIR